MRSVTDGDGRLVMRVAVTRLVVVSVVAFVVTSVLAGFLVGLGWRSVVIGASVAGLALMITALTLRASLGTGWSNGRRFGDQDAVRRIRRAIRRDSTDDLSADEQLVAADYAFQSRDGIVLSAVQSGGLGVSIAMNQLAQVIGHGANVFSSGLLVAAVGLVVAAVIVGVAQQRQTRRFLEHDERIGPVRF
ncbi:MULTISPECIES: hypothetical protein [unclassified Curtobacterium]|uniref:hypothetical protein n=1 Tax=unclassified Curtobacterium TaxID=257496 RepID=UPI00226B77D3|nr:MULTISPECIES: hypothetical protein [unclassified Curtobacterium]